MNLAKLSIILDSTRNYLITSPSDLRYLMGSECIRDVEILIRKGRLFFLGNTLNIEELKRTCSSAGDIIDTSNKDVLNTVFRHLDSLVIDGENLAVARQSKLRELGVTTFVIESSILQSLRKIKTPEEIELLRKSQSINMQALEAVVKTLRSGMSESEIANLIKIKHLELGAEGESFDPVVAIGENGAEPHHMSSPDRHLRSGEQVLIDMGCAYQGYCSDMTRVVFFGWADPEAERLHNLVRQVAYDCLHEAKIGMTYRDLHERSVVLLGEYAPYFTHSLGHGVGLEVHEYPLGMKKIDQAIEENEVFTIEPGIYIPGKYGFRYEIMVVAKWDKFEELK